MKRTLTREEFLSIFNHARDDIVNELVNSPLFVSYDINTDDRYSMLIAQIGWEADGFADLVENITPVAAEVTMGYLTRTGRILGNAEPGDGYKYRGRGYIQLTGRSNYDYYGRKINQDLLGTPSLLENPDTALMVSLEYWATHGCNELADAGDFIAITRRINGGLNGYTGRKQLLFKIRDKLGL